MASKMLGYLTGSESIGGSGHITDFKGKQVGTYRVVSKWKTPRSYVSSTMLQLDVRIAGVEYSARSPGNTLHVLGKRKVR